MSDAGSRPETPVKDSRAPNPGGDAAPAALQPEAILGEIIVYSNQQLLAKYAIEHGEYIIGRDLTCHIMVDADEVSRHHARLIFSGFELIIEDTGSSNGVFIDGVQVQIPTRVRGDQEVQIGSARLRIGLKEAASRQLAAALWDRDLGLEPVREMLESKKYRVITTIGRGGMGVVMQARDLRIRRTVAMKVMKTSAQFSRENVLRFIDEAQLTGQLEHPNIVPVYDLGIDDQGETFYAMKYVKGTTLDEVLRGLRHGNVRVVEKYPLATLITIFQKICDAVAFAHSKEVVHRDLKPENVMIGAYGEVLVMDWGLAKNLTAGRPNQSDASVQTITEEPSTDARGFQTMHGLIVGTPPYISPEQARGELEKIDFRSDVFVLGEILYAILTLRAPVSGANVAEVVEKILNSEITPPSSFNQQPKSSRHQRPEITEAHVALIHCPGRRIPDGLSAVVMKAMNGEPAARYQSVEEMQADLTAWQGGFPTKAERASLLKHGLLFLGRHKGETALLAAGFVIFNVLVIGFIYQLTQEKNRALDNEQYALKNARRAIESEQLAAERLMDLQGTAPTFFEEARNLVEDGKFIEALDKIDYAIEQVPNEPNYLALRGNILQSLLRWPEAIASYDAALLRDPKQAGAKQNLALTKHMIGEMKLQGKLTPAMLRDFHAALLKQGRVDEAVAMLKEIGKDEKVFANTWRAYFDRTRLKERVLTFDDETLQVDMSKMPLADLRTLGDAPVVSLILDDTRLNDLTALKGRKIRSLSLNHTLVRDLAPLLDMPLKSFSAENTRITDLSPLADSPLESVRISGTLVTDLSPLRGKSLEQFFAANCRNLKDLSALHGLPLQTVDISRTGISDLKPIAGAPIRELNLSGCVDLIDLTPLAEMKNLEAVMIPMQCKDIDFLREHPSIKRLSYKKLTQPAYEFWDEFDVKKNAAKTETGN